MQRRIVCAAVKYPKRPDIMLVGPRHFDKVMLDQYLRSFAKGSALGEEDAVCGFLDQEGCFLTREEAYVVAVNAQQILYPESNQTDKLFSENLY